MLLANRQALGSPDSHLLVEYALNKLARAGELAGASRQYSAPAGGHVEAAGAQAILHFAEYLFERGWMILVSIERGTRRSLSCRSRPSAARQQRRCPSRYRPKLRHRAF